MSPFRRHLSVVFADRWQRFEPFYPAFVRTIGSVGRCVIFMASDRDGPPQVIATLLFLRFQSLKLLRSQGILKSDRPCGIQTDRCHSNYMGVDFLAALRGESWRTLFHGDHRFNAWPSGHVTIRDACASSFCFPENRKPELSSSCIQQKQCLDRAPARERRPGAVLLRPVAGLWERPWFGAPFFVGF